MLRAIFSLFLCQALLFGKTIEVDAQSLCPTVEQWLAQCRQQLNNLGLRIPLSLINETDKIGTELLTGGLPITELYFIEEGRKWMPHTLAPENYTENHVNLCSALDKQQIGKAIEKVLKFYASHEDVVIKHAGDLVGLSFLKGVDDKYGKQFQTAFNISNWLSETCNQAEPQNKVFCVKSAKIWEQPKGITWKSKTLMDSIITSTSSVTAIGYEKEHEWNILNDHCQSLLLNTCKVPRVCEKTLYDPVPRSQYYLVNQILQRIFTMQSDCPEAKQFLSDEVNDQLCSKMYQEAELISEMGYPHILRGVFVEYIALCGYLRYPNFFRQDWIDNMLSWQSESEYGCFVNDKGYQQKFWTSDTPVARKTTDEEKQMGLEVDEECLPHYTARALSALSMSWDYMEENCN